MNELADVFADLEDPSAVNARLHSRHDILVVTSNRPVDEWLSLFDDPILGNSALDRLANASYRIVIEGTSYRGRLSPHRALPGAKAGN